MRSENTPVPTKAALSDRDFQQVARIAKSAFGLHLETGKKALIASRLSRRMKELNISSFGQYIDLVKQARSVERNRFVSTLTTNVTQFFREPHHFEYLEKQVLPELARQKRGRPIRIWSAGCSTGQEPYSIAAIARAFRTSRNTGAIKILATDVDADVIKIAQKGDYSARDLAFRDDRLKSLLFAGSNRASAQDQVKICPELQSFIDFRVMNLLGDETSCEMFDVIMCRNVAIYFDRETQSRLWDRLVSQLAPGGTLFIGHSERMHGPASDHLKSVGITTYQRVSGASKPKERDR